MSSFYYWVPGGRPGITSQDLAAAGLGYAITQPTARGCDSGPDSQRGVVVCHGENRDGKLGFFPDKQTWRKIPGKDVWVGWYNDLPTVEDLARETQITGEWVRLGDGQLWLVPMARRWAAMDDTLVWDYNLPCKLSLDDDGKWVPGDVLPQQL